MKKQILILLLLITKICDSQSKPLMSIKELFAEPLYYLRNDTLFTIDVDNNLQICQDSSSVYRLKLFMGNETTLKKYPGYGANSKKYPQDDVMIPYSDISLIIKRLYALPNLQYLDMNFLQLWKFPKEVLRLDKLQVLKMETISFDDQTQTIYHADTVPAALWQMKNLKHLSTYLTYKNGKPFIPYFNESDDNPKTRQYIPDDVKFKVASYITTHSDFQIDNKIQNAWKISRVKQQLKNRKKKDVNAYSLGMLETIFGDHFENACECLYF